MVTQSRRSETATPTPDPLIRPNESPLLLPVRSSTPKVNLSVSFDLPVPFPCTNVSIPGHVLFPALPGRYKSGIFIPSSQSKLRFQVLLRSLSPCFQLAFVSVSPHAKSEGRPLSFCSNVSTVLIL
ncbi:hypothetical protein KOW79_002057 [Hemibagrus wyckioides]|uniref:Uncharacterized protein n=1 Tax=Hemibagrus wyckioides TaxID=337641 RepID=A0A9D3SSM7_9TELE|nr:hypothetical protein KOW79_002057 [Hemibagrus wyckioides]